MHKDAVPHSHGGEAGAWWRGGSTRPHEGPVASHDLGRGTDATRRSRRGQTHHSAAATSYMYTEFVCEKLSPAGATAAEPLTMPPEARSSLATGRPGFSRGDSSAPSRVPPPPIPPMMNIRPCTRFERCRGRCRSAGTHDKPTAHLNVHCCVAFLHGRRPRLGWNGHFPGEGDEIDVRSLVWRPAARCLWAGVCSQRLDIAWRSSRRPLARVLPGCTHRHTVCTLDAMNARR